MGDESAALARGAGDAHIAPFARHRALPLSAASPPMTQAAAAYGGPNWSPRATRLQQEIGTLWTQCGLASEFAPLRRVLLHRPGAELEVVADPDRALMLDRPDAERARRQHDALAEAFASAGVEVARVDPARTPPPNQMFVADLMWMTPSGAVLARPASSVRAGEERWVARRLADLGVPILRSVSGEGTFEGADAIWLRPDRVLLGRGMRTNASGAAQVAAALAELGVETVQVDLPHGAMHLMGQVRIVDRDLAYVQENRTSWRTLEALRECGYEVRFFPDADEIRSGFAHNFVTLGPRRILMPAGNPVSQRAYEQAGITCQTVELDELLKAAGAIGCLSGILHRDDAS
jgi:arginine deiminase